MTFRTYGVSRRGKEPLVEFMLAGLRAAGCSIIRVSPIEFAPFQITFETPAGERMGIVAYAFLANSVVTRNRPQDEYRFQIKYGSKDGELHSLWQDPWGLYTTLFLGIDPERGFFVGADPVLNSPTRLFISKEFKAERVEHIMRTGWHVWEREQLAGRHAEPTEVMVGGTADNFLRYVLFEREAVGEDQGHRHLLAEQFGKAQELSPGPGTSTDLPVTSSLRVHQLEEEFQLRPDEILDLIQEAPRLKMAVRGWVAQRHLVHQLEKIPEVVECEEIAGEGKPDVRVRLRGGKPVLVECKNVLRITDKLGRPKLDFMRTRASLGDPCTRYYTPVEFQILAACLHAQLEEWTFRYRLTSQMQANAKCPGRLEHRVIIDESWTADPLVVLRASA
jgi:hypothetical protein